MPSTGAEPETSAPPVGLNWGVVANRLGIDRRVLEHDGFIVLPGDFFPSEGYFIDPNTLLGRHVDVGDIALRSGYFIDVLTLNEFAIQVPVGGMSAPTGKPVIARRDGPVVGLFADVELAERARRRILRGSLSSDLRIEQGPLGVELRVDRPVAAGSVATIIAGHGGAVLSVGGRELLSGTGAMATASSSIGGQGDGWRPGTGAMSDSVGPPEPASMDSTEVEGGQEFTSN
jgi:hypothetical protein